MEGRRERFVSTSGPATLGSTARADLLLHTWCRNCRHSVNIDSGEQAARYGTNLPVPEWAARLVCSRCASRAVDFVAPHGASAGAGEDRPRVWDSPHTMPVRPHQLCR